ncbi:MAG: hypothetical protein JO249_25325 [Acidobacteria bacterium]|nr:hypothetical protein [Acidobacteriota bacterium]
MTKLLSQAFHRHTYDCTSNGMGKKNPVEFNPKSKKEAGKGAWASYLDDVPTNRIS